MLSWWDSFEAVSRFNTAMAWTGGIFALIAGLCGLLLIASGNRKDELKAKQEEGARQQVEAREKEMRERLDDNERRLGPRILDHTKFLESLKGKPRGKVEILYQPDNSEAYAFALQIRRWLGEGANGDGAGWNVSPLKPIPSEGGDSRIAPDAPSALRHGAWFGLGVRANKQWQPFESETALGALVTALSQASGAGVVQHPDPKLPDDFFVIVVGQKY
jgi:hypothetical protein